MGSPAARTLALIAKHFGAIPKPKRELPALYTEEPIQDGERIVRAWAGGLSDEVDAGAPGVLLARSRA